MGMTGCVEEKIHQGQRYPRRNHNGVVRPIHRIEWERVHGPIPEDKEIHHLCENRACVNVEHLTLVTRSEHMRVHRRGDVCLKGLHEMTEENIRWTTRGERLCRACWQEAQRRSGRAIQSDPERHAKRLAYIREWKRRRRETSR